MLVIKNVNKFFGNKKIIDAISLNVPKGSIAILLGKSGVGKSTLLRILAGLEKIGNTQAIMLDNEPLESVRNKNKHIVGMVFQQFNLFEHLTVLENITLALQVVDNIKAEDAKKIALNLLEHYGLADKANSFISELSGGQKQRLAIARALALKPKIICFDEPTSALDPMLTGHVAKHIEQLAQEGFIVLVATHDTSLVDKLSGTVYLLEQGKIIEQATTVDLKKNNSQFPYIAAFLSGEHHS